jgi:uncharacterized membrane protein YraQ (UPF0718 family)
MNPKRELSVFLLISLAFLAVYYLPVDNKTFLDSITEALGLARWYAREHVLTCLLPAFFIAGAVSVFVSQASVMRYLGARANKILAYSVASVSGTILAVCSCTVLPLFAGIYRMGAGLGPATAFLYSGPAINILAIALTAKVLGPEFGLARAAGAVIFSIVIGLAMHYLFRTEEEQKVNDQAHLPEPEVIRPLWQNAVYFAALVAILVFATWGNPAESGSLWSAVYGIKWYLVAGAFTLLGISLIAWFGVAWWKVVLAGCAVVTSGLLVPGVPLVPFIIGLFSLTVILATTKGEMRDWLGSTWGLTKMILPLLLIGVLVSGFLLGRPGHSGVIPSQWVAAAVGGNSIWANLAAAVLGAFMYFATLTEVPILQGLLGSGMGKGPALALLLAGPALSLPNMLVIRSVMGTKKTLAFITLVIIMATVSGLLFGSVVA